MTSNHKTKSPQDTKKAKPQSTRQLTNELKHLTIARKEIEKLLNEQASKASKMLIATLEENKNSIEQKMLDITQKIYG